MRIVRFWNKLTEYLIDFLKVVSLLIIVMSTIMIVVNLIFKNNDEVYVYSVVVVSLCYLNTKMNGG